MHGFGKNQPFIRRFPDSQEKEGGFAGAEVQGRGSRVSLRFFRLAVPVNSLQRGALLISVTFARKPQIFCGPAPPGPRRV